jgi:hypothetical protein
MEGLKIMLQGSAETSKDNSQTGNPDRDIKKTEELSGRK